jgi:hypothetical protein
VGLVIEIEEGLGGRVSSPGWPELKAILLRMAEGYERDAREVEARIAKAALDGAACPRAAISRLVDFEI